MNKIKKVSEDIEQKTLIRWVSLKHPKIKDLLFHVPNEGKRSPIRGLEMRRMGMRAGIPDLFLSVPRGTYHGMYIELKSLSGKLTPQQQKYLDRFNQEGYLAVCCYGWEEAAKSIEEYLHTV